MKRGVIACDLLPAQLPALVGKLLEAQVGMCQQAVFCYTHKGDEIAAQ